MTKTARVYKIEMLIRNRGHAVLCVATGSPPAALVAEYHERKIAE